MAMETVERLGNARLHAGILWHYGGMEMRKNHFEPATSMLQEALRLCRALKDKHLTAHSLLMLGRVATRSALFEDAKIYELESLHILRDLSDRQCSMQCLFHLGWNSYLAGDFQQATEYIEESYCMGHDVNLKDTIIIPLFAMGLLASRKGDISRAKGYYFEAMNVFKRLSDSSYYFAYCLEAVCTIPGIAPGSAAKILGRAEAIREQKGYYLPTTERHLVEPTIEKLEVQLGKEEFDSARHGEDTDQP